MADSEEPTQRALADALLDGGLLRGRDLTAGLGKIGRYELAELLGEGGAGRVYLATDPALERKVAIKLIERGKLDRARFKRECALLARLDDPGIVAVYDAGEDAGRPFLAMEYVSSQTLADLELDLEQTVRLLQRVAAACQVAHDEGVIHRDLKPRNILVGRRPKIADFGLAKLLEDGNRLTQTGELLGTPHYMAPEQARGEEVDGRVDTYAIGVMLYRALYGQLPHDGGELLALVERIGRVPAAPPEGGGDVDPALAAICARAIAFDPDERYPTVGELAAALASWRAGEGGAQAPARPAWSWRRRLAWVGGVLLALMILGGLSDENRRKRRAERAAASSSASQPASASSSSPASASSAASSAPPALAALSALERALAGWWDERQRAPARPPKLAPLDQIGAELDELLPALEGELRQRALLLAGQTARHAGRRALALGRFVAASEAAPEAALGGQTRFLAGQLAWRQTVLALVIERKRGDGDRPLAKAALERARPHFAAAAETGTGDRWRDELNRVYLSLCQQAEGAEQAAQQALKAFQNIQGETGRGAVALHGDICIAREDYRRAIEVYEHLSSLAPADPEPLQVLSWLRFVAAEAPSQINRALEQGAALCARFPEDPDCQQLWRVIASTVERALPLQLGKTMATLDRVPMLACRDACRAGLARFDSQPARERYATLCLLIAIRACRRGEPAGADIATAKAAWRACKRPGRAAFGVAACDLELARGRRDLKALRAAGEGLARATREAPGWTMAWLWRGSERVLLGEPSGAYRAWRQAATLDPLLAGQLNSRIEDAIKAGGR